MGVSLGDIQIWGPLGPGGDAVPIRSVRVQQDWQRIEARRARAGLGAVNWAKRGPSMAPRAVFAGLGVLGPSAQADVDNAFSQLELTDAQAWNEIAEATAAGVDDATITAYNNAYDLLLDRLIEARLVAGEAGDEDATDVMGLLAELQRDYDELLRQLQQDREGREFGTAASGLLWGLGAATLAAGVLFWTWKNRKRR